MQVHSMRFLTALMLAALWGPSAEATDVGYKLGPGDKLKIKVSEWRPARGQVYEWDVVSGEFTVNVAGSISLPLLGEIPAAGLPTNKLASAISERLQAKVGLVQPPDTSAEIVQFRPFYILGAVNKPGDYPYRPGMTVLQAVGIAGGFYRPAEWRLQREGIASLGDLKVLDVGRSALLARRARLEAEMKGNNAIAFPPELLKQKDNPAIARLLEQERLIFESRRETLRSQTEALNQVKGLLQNEVKSLREKSQVQDRQLNLARQELNLVGSLVSKGLAVNARQLSLEQQMAQIESSRLDLSMAMLRAEQDVNKADRDILALQNRRKDEVATEMQEAELKLNELLQKSETVRKLIAETETVAPQAETEAMTPIFALVRRSEDGVHETIVSENVSVQPDDIIKVRLALGANAPGPQGASLPGAVSAFASPGQSSLPTARPQ